jgi:hypothetical protein
MGISGRKKNMVKGRLDGAVMKFTESQWEERETKGGKDAVNFYTTFEAANGGTVERRFFLGDQKYVRVGKNGGLESVDESRDYKISSDMAAGRLFDSIESAAFADEVPKGERKRVLDVLDDIGDAPEGLDGLWVRLKEQPQQGGDTKQDGTPFTDLIVDELVEEPGEGGGKKKKTTTADKVDKKTAVKSSKKSSKKDDEEEEEEEEGEEGEEDEDEDEDEVEESSDDDPVHAAALDATQKILASLSTKTPLVKNYDGDAAGGGITIKQAYTASFGLLKGKDVKGPGSNMINDPEFHLTNAAEGEYKFNKKKGIIYPAD